MSVLKENPAEEADAPSSKWLWIAAVSMIAVPVLVGFLLMRSSGAEDTADLAIGGTDQGATMGDSGMGGEGGAETAATPTTPGVRDFAEIQATDIVLDFNADLGSATLSVDTTIDVACSVAYGPTQALGSIATDTDMAGGGHSVHHPGLVGLSSGTVWYRLQGTAGDGSLYQSELMQFTFPEGSGAAGGFQPPLPNVAGSSVVQDASSEYSDSFAAENAIDEDPATEWSTAGDGDDAYIVLDLGENMFIAGVGFRTREMSDGTSITTSFIVTVDGRSYGPFEAGPGLAVGLFETSGRVVRIDVDTSTGGNTGAVEIEVYAEPEM